MRIRPYIENKDYEHLVQWVDDERIHALWCANRIPYPITRDNFRALLEKNAMEWTDSAYVATDDSGRALGFFCYSVNTEENTGFLKFIITDKRERGKGYGKKMLRLALKYAFEITNVELVQLNVFAGNERARHCYEQVGFVERSVAVDAFSYKDELWSRCNMVVSREEG